MTSDSEDPGPPPGYSPERDAPHLFHGARASSAAASSAQGDAESAWPPSWNLICWMNAAGLTEDEISTELAVSSSVVTVALESLSVKAKIARLRAEYFGEDLNKEFNSAAPRALKHALRIINGETEASASTQWDATKWMLEKATGKPAQEVNMNGSVGIMHFMKQLEAQSQVKDTSIDALVIEVHAKELDPLAEWVRSNVPSLGSEKSE